jgi:hypothetical protein
MDASLVIAHSDKQLAAGTYKGTWGHHRLMAWCDNTGESLALLLRKRSAGSNTVSDHIDVLDEAITGIPARYRRNLLITLDGAGASHGLVNHITNLTASPWRSVQYSIGWDLGARERAVIGRAPQHTWDHVLDTESAPRGLDEAGVVELTALLRTLAATGAHRQPQHVLAALQGDPDSRVHRPVRDLTLPHLHHDRIDEDRHVHRIQRTM